VSLGFTWSRRGELYLFVPEAKGAHISLHRSGVAHVKGKGFYRDLGRWYWGRKVDEAGIRALQRELEKNFLFEPKGDEVMVLPLPISEACQKLASAIDIKKRKVRVNLTLSQLLSILPRPLTMYLVEDHELPRMAGRGVVVAFDPSSRRVIEYRGDIGMGIAFPCELDERPPILDLLLEHEEALGMRLLKPLIEGLKELLDRAEIPSTDVEEKSIIESKLRRLASSLNIKRARNKGSGPVQLQCFNFKPRLYASL